MNVLIIEAITVIFLVLIVGFSGLVAGAFLGWSGIALSCLGYVCISALLGLSPYLTVSGPLLLLGVAFVFVRTWEHIRIRTFQTDLEARGATGTRELIAAIRNRRRLDDEELADAAAQITEKSFLAHLSPGSPAEWLYGEIHKRRDAGGS